MTSFMTDHLLCQSFIASPLQKKDVTVKAFEDFCGIVGQAVEIEALESAIEKLNKKLLPFDLGIRERRKPHGKYNY